LSETVRVIVGMDDVACLPADLIAEKIRRFIRVKLEVVVDTSTNVATKIIQEGKRKTITFFDYRNQ